MAVLTRVVSRRIPGPEVALFRFALGVVAVVGARVSGHVLRPRRWGWLLARGLFGGVAVYLYFSCIEHAGVGIATLLNYTAPVWTLLLTWWLLGERPRPQAVAALALTLLGVVCVVGGSARPGGGAGWTLVGVVSAFCSGVAVTSIRAVRRPALDGSESESSWTVFASFTALGVLATVPGVVAPLGRWVTPRGIEWPLLLAVGSVSVVAQLLMTDALQHLTGATMGIIQQIAVVFALVCGVALLGERLTAPALVGSVLTISGVAWTVVATRATLRP